MTALAVFFAKRSQRQTLDAERRQHEKLYKLLFEQTKDIVAVTTPEGRLVDINPAGIEYFGFSSKEEFQKADLRDLYVHTEDRDELRERLQRDGFASGFETENRRLDGEIRVIQNTATAVRDETGGVAFFLAILRDVTEAKRLAAEREAMVTELEARNSELRSFARTVSHDLKSPLITIKGFLGLLQDHRASGDEERVDRDVKTIALVADRMQVLIEDLLEYSRIDRRQEDWAEIDLGRIAREAVMMVGGRTANAGAQVEVATDLPRVLGDPTLLRMVFQNLVDNAVKFFGDQAEPRVHIGARHDSAEAVLFVEDNGVGIEAKNQEKVFELFKKLTSDDRGTGIGLASVKRIIEIHGGRVWVESEGRGKGATFCFTLTPSASGSGEEDST
jgi:PAS domain S-box-containing protein